MTDLIGLIGTLLLAGCSLPQVYQCYKTKSAEGVSLYFILMWFLGLLFTTTYVFLKNGLDLYLHTTYLMNLVSCLIILRYKAKNAN